MTFSLTHQYADLGKQFSQPAVPEKVPNAQILLWNNSLANDLGIDVGENHKANYFSGQQIIHGSLPVAMAYSGHQFGQFNPQLGDGRAHLLGELIDRSGQVKELHLKGSGRTPFSRNGDGKCGIQPAVREYIMSEAMFALQVPTTRTLAVVTTGEPLARQTQTTGAVVTRVAQSHLRIGTFEHFAARNMPTEVKRLADFAIERHFPATDIDDETKYFNLLANVIEKQINLVVEWMRVGFIHGVMNTDNSLLSGETIDYGPCAMLGIYDTHTVYSSIDHQGRYAFGNQPWITQWNLARFAECLLPLIDADEKLAVNKVMPLLEGFGDQYMAAFNRMMAAKIGIRPDLTPPESLIKALLDLMQKHQLDYTQTFYELTEFRSIQKTKSNLVPHQSWMEQWSKHLNDHAITDQEAFDLMRNNNPVVIPRNHHVERVLSETESRLTPDAVNDFMTVLRSPYEVLDSTHRYQDAAADGDLNYQTFCGT